MTLHLAQIRIQSHLLSLKKEKIPRELMREKEGDNETEDEEDDNMGRGGGKLSGGDSDSSEGFEIDGAEDAFKREKIEIGDAIEGDMDRVVFDWLIASTKGNKSRKCNCNNGIGDLDSDNK